MHLPIKLICKKSKIRNDGTSLIFVQYCYSPEKRVLISTDVAIPPQYWNNKLQRISQNLPNEFGIVQEMSDGLTSKLRHAEDLVNLALKQSGVCPMTFLKDKFKSPFPKSGTISIKQTVQNLDVFENIEQYKLEKKGMVKQCTINVINAMKIHLGCFQDFRKKKITFESFDFQFYNDFVNFLTYNIAQTRRKEIITGLKINTIGKTIKHLKAFLKDRIKRKIIPPIDLNDYQTLSEDVDSIYLTTNEISTIYHLDLSGKAYLEKYRDLFILGCLTGFRFSDYSVIKPEELRDGMLYINQQKTGSTVIVPLQKEAKIILVDKYKMKIPAISNPKFNEYIKEVCRLAGIDANVKITNKKGNKRIEEIRPKYAWVTSHTCRRSFCTNEYLLGTPIELIMAISGHKTEKSFRKYIKADSIQKADMIKKIWHNRAEL